MKQGYTLIELLLCIFIIAMFAAVVSGIAIISCNVDKIAHGAGELAGEVKQGYEEGKQ